jgi:hypothetical protein
VQTPRFCGDPSSAGDLLLNVTFSLLDRINWLIVGNGGAPKYEKAYKFNKKNQKCQYLPYRHYLFP